ncbi:hypothetical protein KJ849_03385 [bacterium]|nr:hypothetical protein [bacterium]
MPFISKIIILIILIFPTSIFAAFEDKILGSRAQGLGGAFTALANDYNAIYYNPAGLSKLILPTISSNYQSLFNLSPLRNQSLSLTLPLKKHQTLALDIQFFGKDLYQEKCLSLSYALSLSKNSYLGLNIKWLRLEIFEAGKVSSTGIDLGFLYEATKNLSFGLMVKNINQPFLGESLPLNYRVGLKLDLNPAAIFVSDLDSHQRIYIGIELYLDQGFIIRNGFLTKPQRYTLGLGIKKKRVFLDYALVSHPVLSFTNQFSLTMVF